MESSKSPMSKPMTPRALILHHHGSVQVKLSASVVDSENLSFTVPRKDVQRALDSLQVSDSRGTTPKISFQAPAYISTGGLHVRSETAWSDIVRENQGALVSIELQDASAMQGHLMGLNSQPNSDLDISESHLLLLKNSKVSSHPVHKITSISFMDSATTEKLERFTSLRNRIMDTKSHYRIQIHAQGSGSGEVTASYEQASLYTPAYNISYMCCKDEGSPEYGIHPSTLKCHAIIRNPIHVDLCDVEVTLYSGQVRKSGDAEVDYNQRDKGSEHSGSESGTATVSETNADSDIQKHNLLDYVSSSHFSNTSLYAFEQGGAAQYHVSEKLSMKVGESARVFIFEKRTQAGIIHIFETSQEKSSAEKSCCFTNSTDAPLGPGSLMIRAGGKLYSNKIGQYLQIGGRLSSGKDFSGCRTSNKNSSIDHELLSYEVIDGNMVLKLKCIRTSKYELHNKETLEIQLVVIHRVMKSCLSRYVAKDDIKATLHTASETTIINPSEYQYGHPWVIDYWLRLKAGQECSLVVVENGTKVLKIAISDGFSNKLIATLQSEMAISGDVAGLLKEHMALRRELQKLRRERKLHGWRLFTLRKYQQRQAKEEPKDYEDSIANKFTEPRQTRDSFLYMISSVEESIFETTKNMDDIESMEIQLCKELRQKELKICNLKELN